MVNEGCIQPITQGGVDGLRQIDASDVGAGVW
jgi:hypothetical protein